jgi:hypothetical protein
MWVAYRTRHASANHVYRLDVWPWIGRTWVHKWPFGHVARIARKHFATNQHLGNVSRRFSLLREIIFHETHVLIKGETVISMHSIGSMEL